MPDDLFTPCSSRRSNRLNHSLTLTPYSGSTNRFLFSAIPDMINLWNSLPFSPDSCTSVYHFKSQLLLSL